MLNTIVFFTSRLPSLDCLHTLFFSLRVYKQLLILLTDGTHLKILQHSTTLPTSRPPGLDKKFKENKQKLIVIIIQKLRSSDNSSGSGDLADVRVRFLVLFSR